MKPLDKLTNLGMDQYLLIPFLGGWTSIYQLFWCSPGVQGFDTLPFTNWRIDWYDMAVSENRVPPIIAI